MNQSDILRACRNRTPDSFAPDGQPLLFIPVSKLRRKMHGCCARKNPPHSGLRLPTHGRAAGADDRHLLPQVIGATQIVTLGCAPTHVATEGVTHRDLSQHAETCVSNRNEIVVPHGEVR